MRWQKPVYGFVRRAGLPSGGVVHFDTQRLQKAHIIGVDGEFWIWIPLVARTNEFGRGRRTLFVAAVESNCGLEDQKNIEPLFLNSGDYVGDLVGFGKRVVDGLSKLFHELLQLRIHVGSFLILNLDATPGRQVTAKSSG